MTIEAQNSGTAANPDNGEATNTPATPAQGAAPNATADAETIAEKVAGTVFAALRRAGVLDNAKKTKTKSDETPATTPQTAPTLDPLKLRELDRAITRLGHAERLNPTAYKRIERAFCDEMPDDADAWLTDYFDGLGFAKQSPATPNTNNSTNTTVQTQPKNELPVTNRGTPPAPKMSDDEVDLLAMSPAEREQMARTKGNKWFRDRLTAQIRDQRFALKR